MLASPLVISVDTACAEVRGYLGLHLNGQFVMVNLIVQEDMSRSYEIQKNGGKGGQNDIQVFISMKWAWPVRTSTGWGVGIGSRRLTLLAADCGQDQGAGRRIKVARKVGTLRSLEQMIRCRSIFDQPGAHPLQDRPEVSAPLNPSLMVLIPRAYCHRFLQHFHFFFLINWLSWQYT